VETHNKTVSKMVAVGREQGGEEGGDDSGQRTADGDGTAASPPAVNDTAFPLSLREEGENGNGGDGSGRRPAAGGQRTADGGVLPPWETYEKLEAHIGEEEDEDPFGDGGEDEDGPNDEGEESDGDRQECLSYETADDGMREDDGDGMAVRIPIAQVAGDLPMVQLEDLVQAVASDVVAQMADGERTTAQAGAGTRLSNDNGECRLEIRQPGVQVIVEADGPVEYGQQITRLSSIISMAQELSRTPIRDEDLVQLEEELRRRIAEAGADEGSPADAFTGASHEW